MFDYSVVRDNHYSPLHLTLIGRNEMSRGKTILVTAKQGNERTALCGLHKDFNCIKHDIFLSMFQQTLTSIGFYEMFSCFEIHVTTNSCCIEFVLRFYALNKHSTFVIGFLCQPLTFHLSCHIVIVSQQTGQE